MRIYFFLFLTTLFFSHAYAAPAKKTLVILGDSLTAGYGVEKDAAFPSLIQKKLHDKGLTNFEVVASGISGSTSASGPARMKWILKSKPDFLLLELGANDGLRGFDLLATEKNLKTVIAMAKDNKIRVALVAMQIPANYGKEYTEKFQKMFKNIAHDEKIELIPFFFKDLMVSTKKNLLLADGLHPNEDGHKLISEKLLEYLIPLL